MYMLMFSPCGGVQSMGGEGMTDEERKLKQQKAMADPEIQARRPPSAHARSAADDTMPLRQASSPPPAG